MDCIKKIVLACLILTFSQTSFAGTSNVVSCSQKDNGTAKKYDYGDAPTSYGVACNSTDTWQNLGAKGDWNKDYSGQAVDSDNASDNGVQWRTQGEDGTWSEWSSTDSLTQGDNVEFKFSMTRLDEGNHKYDLLKAWVDWNGSGTFQNNLSETVVNEKWWKDRNTTGDSAATMHVNNLRCTPNSTSRKCRRAKRPGYDWNYDLNKYNSKVTQAVIISQLTIPVDAALGDTWLRARVVCENSLEHYADNFNLLPTGFQDQGETEDYRLTIVAKPPVDVPEPSTLFLFSACTLALLMRRKKS